jgi:threonine dehydrogenase-like Zn-dependent dehydrogenase
MNINTAATFAASTFAQSETMRLVTSMPHALPDPATARVAVIGLGYVGLPLALGFAHASRSIGFDISTKKIEELKA